MRLFSITLVVLTLMSGVVSSVNAQQAVDKTLRDEYEQKKVLINEMFQTKIDKINRQISLPENILNLLIKQADEVREFDLYTLDRKFEMKMRHATERDAMRERLRFEAQNRVKWLIDNDDAFNTVREERKTADAEKLKTVDVVPANKPASAPKNPEKSAEKSAKNVAETPASVPNASTQASAAKTAEQTAEKAVEKSVEKTAEKTAAKSAEKSAETSAPDASASASAAKSSAKPAESKPVTVPASVK